MTTSTFNIHVMLSFEDKRLRHVAINSYFIFSLKFFSSFYYNFLLYLHSTLPVNNKQSVACCPASSHSPEVIPSFRQRMTIQPITPLYWVSEI